MSNVNNQAGLAHMARYFLTHRNDDNTSPSLNGHPLPPMEKEGGRLKPFCETTRIPPGTFCSRRRNIGSVDLMKRKVLPYGTSLGEVVIAYIVLASTSVI